MTLCFLFACTCAGVSRGSLRSTAGGAARQIDTFLGLLYLAQDYKIYGYVTNTGVRLVLVLDENDNKDSSIIKALFRKLHALIIESMSNPFYVEGQPLTSKKLENDLGASRVSLSLSTPVPASQPASALSPPTCSPCSVCLKHSLRASGVHRTPACHVWGHDACKHDP
jgi:hypothetical protein